MNANPSNASPETKAAALRRMVRKARVEQRAPFPRQVRNPYGPEFDAAGWQQMHLDALIDVLKTTDALDVLDELLNGESA